MISRPLMFYARPSLRAKDAKILLGFSREHVLNRMMSEVWRTKKGLIRDGVHDNLRTEDRDGAFEARHLSKYVFPLQYKLNNVFHPSEDRTQDEILRRHFIDREEEIETKGSCKTPQRLKNVLRVLARLFKRHEKYGYKVLLDKLCPSKLNPDFNGKEADSAVILGLISDDNSENYLQSQLLSSSEDTIPSVPQNSGDVNNTSSMASKGDHPKQKPKFSEFTCRHNEVYLFVRSVTRAVIPHELWGCHHNKKVIMHNVKQLISGGRYENLSLHTVMQGIRTSECEWLLPVSLTSGKLKLSRHTPAETHKRDELMREFVFWYFDQFLVPLLRTTFYITESNAFRSRVLYFRQDDWDILCRPVLDQLAGSTFERIDQHEAENLLQQRRLGYSSVRLLPKESGVRPIVNLRRQGNKNGELNSGQSINQILSAAFQILTFEKINQADKLGSSVFGPNEVYSRLKAFKKKITKPSGEFPKLYFVKVDVKACFDSIEQEKLLSILKDIISEDIYTIQRYGKVYPTTEQPLRNFCRNAIPEYDHPHFLTYAKQLATLLRHVVLADQVVYPHAFREDIIQLLEEHISCNVVKIGQDYYRQRVGIPQGSVLSTLLCSFFYGHLEEEELKFAIDPEKENTLLRLIDDYLFITTDIEEARQFLQIMERGHPEYGCFISRDKTLTNFDHRVGDISQNDLSAVLHPEDQLFPWCGYLFDTRNLSVMSDYSRLYNKPLTDSLTVERSNKPNTRFLQKLMQSVKAKSHIIFTDTSLNTSDAVYINLYQAFILAAMKMHTYVRAAKQAEYGGKGSLAFLPSASETSPATSKGDRKQRQKRTLQKRIENRGSSAFLLKAIRRSVSSTYSAILNKAQGRLAQESGGRCELSQDEVVWLGTHAFYNILKRKSEKLINRSGLISPLNENRHLSTRSRGTALLLLHKYHQNNRILPSLSSTTHKLCHPRLRQSSPTLSLFVSSSREYSSTLSTNQREQQSNKMTAGVDFYSLNAPLPGKDKVYDFDQLKGKVVLIVNVASKCGFTPQYKGLEALYKKFKDRGFVILGFPCNQFGSQEPGTDEEISQFCELNHGVTFPLMQKSDVNGDNTNPVYKWLKDEKAGLLGLTRVKWNFEKFLIDKNGKVAHRWASTKSPESIEPEIEKLLNEGGEAAPATEQAAEQPTSEAN
ncbi:telomerase reverse transcriptase [Pyrrhoderma noxium]|uniref:Telomerase reverse transcriptase n=1 Tax=Pyrrhoderma noxium TaxID=2282107 RepID=A0A286U9I3_9AGAM|nr:telomerase reverse transcriptase [Pyrrhoderma noxium]